MRLILTALFVFLAANFAMAADRVKNDKDDTKGRCQRQANGSPPL